jgi:hypothetical protein
MKPEKIKEIYQGYCDRCKAINKVPVLESEFNSVVEKSSQVIVHLLKSSKEPYIAVEIDDTFILYQEVRDNSVILNVWDKDQYTLLLKGDRNDPKRDDNKTNA